MRSVLARFPIYLYIFDTVSWELKLVTLEDVRGKSDVRFYLYYVLLIFDYMVIEIFI